MLSLKKIYNFFNKHATTILVVAMLFYVAIFFGISYWKYSNFLYNSLDLAIFNQVFYNTSHGRLFQLSIHAPTYLGDHFAPIILILSLFYSLFRSPLTLLFLQTVILALSAWPIYLISKKIINNDKGAKPPIGGLAPANKVWPMAIGLTWLLNPLVQNANLFEFHLLPFAVFLLFWVFYFYLQKKWGMFFLFVFLSLLAREDVSLVIFGFGILAVIDGIILFKKTKKQKIAGSIVSAELWSPIATSQPDSIALRRLWSQRAQRVIIGIALCLISITWLLLSLKIIGNYAPAGNYKFLYYYSWLGNSISEIIISIFSSPLKLLKHFLSISNLEMILGLLLPFVFLPLWSKKYLILLIGPLLQLMIGSPGGSALILQTHYNLLLLPALVISSIYAFKYFLDKPIGQKSRFEIVRILTKEKKFLLIIFIVGTIYASLSLGPLPRSIYKIISEPLDSSRIDIKQHFLNQIPAQASVAATYEFLNNLSSRQNIYAMHYGFIGRKQYSKTDYKLPSDTEYLLIDFNDFFLYQIQFSNIPIYSSAFNSADDRMRELLENYELMEIFDDYALFQKNKKTKNLSRAMSREQKNKLELYQLVNNKPENEQSVDMGGKIKFLGWEINQKNKKTKKQKNKIPDLLPLSFFWQAQIDLSSDDLEKPADNYQLKLLVVNNNKIVYKNFYPLGYGIFPTSEWPAGKTVKTNYWFYLPEEFAKADNILQFELTQVDGHMELNSWRSAELKYTETVLKPVIVVGRIGELVD